MPLVGQAGAGCYHLEGRCRSLCYRLVAGLGRDLRASACHAHGDRIGRDAVAVLICHNTIQLPAVGGLGHRRGIGRLLDGGLGKGRRTGVLDPPLILQAVTLGFHCEGRRVTDGGDGAVHRLLGDLELGLYRHGDRVGCDAVAGFIGDDTVQLPAIGGLCDLRGIRRLFNTGFAEVRRTRVLDPPLVAQTVALGDDVEGRRVADGIHDAVHRLGQDLQRK